MVHLQNCEPYVTVPYRRDCDSMSKYKRKPSKRSAQHRRRYTRQRAVGYVAAVLIVAGLIVGDRMGVFGRRPAPKQREYRPDAATLARNNAADLRTYHNKSFKVTYVVDGDTLDVDIRDEVLSKKFTRIRLWGVDTPETVKPNTPKQHFGPEASRFTRNFGMGMDRIVRLELVKGSDTRDMYGRLLAYVSLPPAGAGENPVCLNAELIWRGFGYSDPRFPHPRKPEFHDLQRRARQSGVGLWADAGDEDLPYYYRDYRVKIKLGQ